MATLNLLKTPAPALEPNISQIVLLLSIFFKKMGQLWPLFHLFLVFSNKHYYNFYNKYMWQNVDPVYDTGIRTHDLQNMSLFP